MIQLELPLKWPDRVTPYERDVVTRVLLDLARWCGGPVPSCLVADHLAKSERTARLYLARLERAGYVRRPAGQRSGWMTVENPCGMLAVN